jgi:hypothetical protein
MGLERVRIALVRGFDIPRGPLREDALDWVKEQEDRQLRRQHIMLVATIAAAIGAWLAALILTAIALVLIARFVIVVASSEAVQLGVNEAGDAMSLGTILIIILILVLLGVIPTWGHSRAWGYGPSGIVGLILIIVIILALLGRL